MPRPPLVLVLLPLMAACASQSPSAAKKSVDAVVLEETQRHKAVAAAQAGETSSQALAHVADGPKEQKPVPQ
ncbi:MAG: hypothetical protein ACJ798_01105 [Phenylobacterium sp.]